MDYDQTVLEMLGHLEANFSDEAYAQLAKSLGIGLATMLSRIGDHALMHTLLQEIFTAIEQQACDMHNAEHSSNQEVDAETFLRDYFQPTKTND